MPIQVEIKHKEWQVVEQANTHGQVRFQNDDVLCISANASHSSSVLRKLIQKSYANLLTGDTKK